MTTNCYLPQHRPSPLSSASLSPLSFDSNEPPASGEEQPHASLPLPPRAHKWRMDEPLIDHLFENVRQEDGNEAQLFGLLIRPSPATQQTQQSLPGALPIATISAGASSIQIVPAPSPDTPKKVSAKDGRNASRVGGTMFNASQQKCPTGSSVGTALFASATSSGMPPILPRPKQGKSVARTTTQQHQQQQQQLMRSLLPLPSKTTLTFEMAQSPSQVVPQLGTAAIGGLDGCEALSVSTNASGSSSSSTPSLTSVSVFPSQASPSSSAVQPNGLLTIQSPPPKTQPIATSTGEKSTTKAPRRRKSRQMLALEETEKEEGKKSSSNGTETDGAGGGGGADLLGDLHSIEYSQLVNSSVITTEDYLPSQSDPIYTNMDMYNSTLGTHGPPDANESVKGHQQKQTHADKNVLSSSALCPSAIFLHNQQHHQQQQQQHHFANMQTNSATLSSSVRFVANGPVVPSQHSAHWHPYMGAHPGGPSHISSTPDSGIQSIDGSPPSVYTPPMVSPYASQVRSCESVNNGMLASTVCAGGVANSSISIGATSSFYGPAAFSSHTEESLQISALSSSSSIFLSSSSSLMNVPPSLIIEQLVDGGDNNESAEQQQQEADFSDMPKLVPVTHTEHDEEVAEEDVVRPEPGTTEDDRRRGGPTDVLFHQGMSLHELAECLSSNISREQLKQLTSLIQRKAEEQKNLEGGHGNGKLWRDENNEDEQRQKQVPVPSSVGEEGRAEVEEERLRKESSEVIENGAVEEEEQNVEEDGGGDEDEEEDEVEEEEVEKDERKIEQLTTYRARVREQLNRKLAALVDRVIRRMEECHLNLSTGDETLLPQRGWPWRKLNWEEVHRKAEARGARWMPELMMKKRKGRKRKTAKGEDEEEEEVGVKKREEDKERGEDDEGRVREEKKEKKTKSGRRREGKSEGDDLTQKRAARKRKRKETDEETEKQTKKAQEDRELRDEKREEFVREENQTKKVRAERGERDEKREEFGREENRTKKVRAERGERDEKREEFGREENRTKKVRAERGERDEKREEFVREEKQGTPPIILRIRTLPPSPARTSALMTIKRATAPRRAEKSPRPSATAGSRKPSSSPRPSCSTLDYSLLRERAHSNFTMSINDGERRNGGVGGRRWTTGRRAKGTGIPTTTATGSAEEQPTRARRSRKRRPNPDKLSDRERAIVHSTGCFLVRNLCGGRQPKDRTQCQASCPNVGLVEILCRILADFCSIFDRRLMADRQLNELYRTAKLMFASVPDPSDLLTRFDSLLKQFISSSLPNALQESIQTQFAHLKQSVQFGKVHCLLQKDALCTFLDERIRSSSASSKRDTFQRPLTVDTSIDLSYLDSAHAVGQWDPDKAAKLSPSNDNRDRDCVRCICGIAEDDGIMSQCDRCHFWLHADCLDCPVLDDQKEFVCDFCTRRLETTARVDIVLKPQPIIKLSGCSYYRTLVNSRGLQVRLNESVYVERLINDKHKSILRELHEECVRKQQLAHTPQQSPQKRGRGPVRRKFEGAPRTELGKGPSEEGTTSSKANRWWPEEAEGEDGWTTKDFPSGNAIPSTSSSSVNMPSAPSESIKQCFHRRDLRVFRIERLFCSPNGQRFIFGCYYARPHETFCDSSRTFYRNELFWTPLFDTLPLDSVVGRCLVLEPQIWAMGRPKSPRYLEDDVFVCEYQIDRNQRSFEKIPPKNRYYINTEPYVFNMFEKKLTMRRDFTPFKVTGNCSLNYNNKSSSSARTDIPPTLLFNNTLIIRQQLLQQHLESVCSKIGVRSSLRAVEH
uniref:BAH domain-containing protein n=1 Tax=Globodera pallida TaxID=36090 RepID=A0A183CE81_GLOPA